MCMCCEFGIEFEFATLSFGSCPPLFFFSFCAPVRYAAMFDENVCITRHCAVDNGRECYVYDDVFWTG